MTYATAHCANTIPTVAQNDLNSFLIVETAAIQGVYKSVNTRKLIAVSGVNTDGSTDASESALVPHSTASDDTTASFAVKPEISAVVTLQSSKPSGRKITEIALPIYASKLVRLSSVKFSL